MSDRVRNPEDRVSHNEAQLIFSVDNTDRCNRQRKSLSPCRGSNQGPLTCKTNTQPCPDTCSRLVLQGMNINFYLFNIVRGTHTLNRQKHKTCRNRIMLFLVLFSTITSYGKFLRLGTFSSGLGKIHTFRHWEQAGPIH